MFGQVSFIPCESGIISPAYCVLPDCPEPRPPASSSASALKPHHVWKWTGYGGTCPGKHSG